MSQTSKIVLAVIITAVVVGGVVYFWQQSKIAIKTTFSEVQETSKQSTQNPTTSQKEPAIVPQIKTQMNLTTYSSEKYSFKYPQGYFVQEPSTKITFPVLTVRKAANQKEADANAMIASKNRLEIFQMKDFGDRPWGFSGDETQEDIDGYVPKDMLTVGTGDKKYDVWLFYSKNDNTTKKELMTIFDSIIIK